MLSNTKNCRRNFSTRKAHATVSLKTRTRRTVPTIKKKSIHRNYPSTCMTTKPMSNSSVTTTDFHLMFPTVLPATPRKTFHLQSFLSVPSLPKQDIQYDRNPQQRTDCIQRQQATLPRKVHQQIAQQGHIASPYPRQGQ